MPHAHCRRANGEGTPVDGVLPSTAIVLLGAFVDELIECRENLGMVSAGDGLITDKIASSHSRQIESRR